MNFFAKKPTVREAAKSASKETKKEVRSNQHQIDRDIRDLDRQEKLLLQEIKSRAKSPGVNPATDKGLKSQAKQLVQIRKQKETSPFSLSSFMWLKGWRGGQHLA